MSFQEFVDRLRYRVLDYWNSEKRSVKIISRLAAFSLFALAITTIAPTLADELSSSPEMLQPVTQDQNSSETTTVVTIEETATPTAAPTFSPEPEISRPAISNPSQEPLPESSDSATSLIGEALKDQPKYTMRIPSSPAIDPRATTYTMPHIYVAVDDPEVKFTLVCINSSGINIDAAAKRVANNEIEPSDGENLITGDLSSLLLVSGSTNKVINFLNSSGGLFLSSKGGGLAGRSLTFRFVAVSKPTVEPEICASAKNGVITTVRALGLDLSTVKGGGKLK